MRGATRARARPAAAAGLAAAAICLLLGGPLVGGARSEEPPPVEIDNPLAGDGMWIWYVSRAGGGDVNRIAAKAHRRGLELVLIKSGDGGRLWRQFTPELVTALKARGLRVCAWQFVYGRRPKREARIGAKAVRRGADCLVIDAEGQYEGRYAKASTYIRKLRNRIGPAYPVALASFPYVDYHPGFPYSVFLGPGGAQFNVPQLYWKTIGDKVDTAFVHTYVFNRGYARPILPLGQVYLNPKGKAIRRFRRLAVAHGMAGVSWWSWQHARRRQWKAVGARVAPLEGYVTYDSFPFLRLGSKGDLVVWVQQLLAGGGYSTPITGYFKSATRAAVLALQADRGLPLTGNVDVPTWEALLEHDPLPVRWTQAGAVAAGAVAAASSEAMPEPRSARLPARRYEIPPPDRRLNSAGKRR